MSIYETPFLLGYCCVLAAVLGAALGSFLHCTAYRVARGQSFVKGRSHCPQCGHALGPLDLVPVFSWLALRGRCRYCGARVPARYVLAECFFAAVTVLCLLRFDLTALCLRNYVFACCLFCLSLTDLDAMLIPDGCLLAALLAWLVALPFLGEPVTWGWAGRHLLAAAVYGGGLLLLGLGMDRLLQKESLGGGDIKLFAVVGLYLGLAGTLFALLLACVLGLVFAAAAKKRNTAFPFGPAISAAALLMLFYGGGLVRWYTGLLGLG